MLQNYLKVALRNIRSNKIYSTINIVGFAIGLASCLLILLFVYNEVSYEYFQKNKKRIYRVGLSLKHGDTTIDFAAAMPPLAPAMADEYPEIETYTRIRPIGDVSVEINGKTIQEKKLFYAQQSFFDMFSFDLSNGDIETALSEPYSIILSFATAKKYFGEEYPVGKQLIIDENHTFNVTGVLDKPKGNSQLNFDLLASYSSLDKMGFYSDEWGQFGVDHNFIMLNPTADSKELQTKLPDLLLKHLNAGFASMLELKLQRFDTIYFHSKMNGELEPSGDLDQVKLFSLIAGFIMLIACLNFMNLSTARSIHRSKEVGMRKVFGSYRSQLINQFLSESVLLTLISMLLGIVIFYFLYPALNNFIGRELSIDYLKNPISLIVIFCLSIIIGLLSGIYPAFFLSRFNPLTAIKAKKGKNKTFFRKIMVIIQFSIAIGLIFTTIIVYKQLYFVKKADLGFNKEDVVVVPLMDSSLQQKYDLIRSELSSIEQVKSSSSLFAPPGNPSALVMNIQPEEGTSEDGIMVNGISCDENYIPMFEIEILEGRNFSKDLPSDPDNTIILNEKAVEKLGLTDPIGKKLMVPSGQNDLKAVEIIGVVKNFHFGSLRGEISPAFLFIRPDLYQHVTFKIDKTNIQRTLEDLKNKWNEVAPDFDFDYSFLDDDYASMYSHEEKMGKLFIFFTLLIIFVASMGIFGLSSFMAEQRTQEIGVRKVMGASSISIVFLLAKDFMKWVLFANIIALPIGYWRMKIWLQDFAYKTDMSIWVFLSSASIALIIAFVTIYFHTYRCAIKNPVETLKYE